MMKKTLNKRLLIVTLSIAIPFIALIGFWGVNEQKRSREEEIEKNQKEIEITVSQMDTMLELMENSIVSLVMYDSDLLEAATETETTTNFWLSNQKISQKLSNLTNVSSIKFVPFIYYSQNDTFYNNKVNEEMTNLILNQIRNKSENPLLKGWQTLWLEDEAYLYLIIEYPNYFIGVWGGFSEYYNNIIGESSEETTNEKYYFVDLSGQVIAGDENSIDLDKDIFTDENGDKWDIIKAYSSQVDCYILKLIKRNSQINNLAGTNNEVLFVSIVFVLLFFVYIFFIYKWIIVPMNHIRKSMKVMRVSDSEYQITDIRNTSVEFENIINEFNSLMTYIKDLKIEMYENKLVQNEIQLEYLGRQIQPHFILNTLNTIYNYVEEDPKLTKDIIKLVSKYYRYVINISSQYVKIENELEHIENYLKLQKIRYGKSFNYKITCDKKIKEYKILSFIIESFVGNAIKHGIKPNEKTLIELELFNISKDKILIRISDTGEGFDYDKLDAINEYINQGVISEELGVGIKNSFERLRLTYENNFNLKMYNKKPHGAVVEIEIHFTEEYNEY